MHKIILFSDDRELKDAVKALLSASRYQCDEIHDKNAFLGQLGNADYFLIVLDARAVGGDMDLVSILRGHGSHRLLWLTPENAIAGAAEAVRRGADFYLTLPMSETYFR